MNETSQDPKNETSQDHLHRNALGTPGIVFFVVAAAAPLAATVGLAPLIFSSNGVGAPGAFAVAAIVFLLFAVGLSAMTRHVSSAGGFAVLISRGLGERAGFAAAFVALLSYNGFLLGAYGAFGFFAATVVNDLFGLNLPWEVWAGIAIGLVAWFGYRDVNTSARVLGVVLVGEVAILLIFAVVVLVGGGDSGWTAEPFKPNAIFSGAEGLALLFAFGAFIGFEATALYGEEARDPRRSVPRATYVAVLLIGGFYLICNYALAVAYGPDNVAKAAVDDPVGFVLAANTEYVGSFSTDVMRVLLMTSLFAGVLAFHNALSRYFFSISRAGLLPAALARTHPRNFAPSRASVAQTVISVVVVGAFMVADADPYMQLFAWLAGLGIVGILALQATASLAVVGFFLRTRLERNPWTTLVAPLLAAAGLITADVLAVDNWGVLAIATTGVLPYLPWLLVLAAIVGVVVGEICRRNGAQLDRGFDVTEAEPAVSSRK